VPTSSPPPLPSVQPRGADRRLALLPLQSRHFVAQRLVLLAQPMILFP
jgi:hypothetical protein